MNWMTFNQFSSFHYDFTKCWVSMNCKGNIFKRSAHFNRKTKLSDQVGSFKTYDLSADHNIVIRIRNEFDESFSMVQGYGTAIARKREFTALHVNALFFCFLLSVTYTGDFRISEADSWHSLVINYRRQSCDSFSCYFTFVGSFMSQCKTRNDVPDCKDFRIACTSLVVNNDHTTVIQFNTSKV
ncbi:hypothetical protein D3C76_1124010 [compost metagenome]